MTYMFSQYFIYIVFTAFIAGEALYQLFFD